MFDHYKGYADIYRNGKVDKDHMIVPVWEGSANGEREAVEKTAAEWFVKNKPTVMIVDMKLCVRVVSRFDSLSFVVKPKIGWEIVR